MEYRWIRNCQGDWRARGLRLTETDIVNLLVIGVDLVSLATSAKKAGYPVYAVGYFGDQDLKPVCLKTQSLIRQKPGETCGRLSARFNPGDLLLLTKELLKGNEIHGTLLSSGLDDSSDVLSELDEMVPIIGNQPEIISEVRDKIKFFRELKRLGIPHPETAIAENLEEARKTSNDIGFPVLVKPASGFGGANIRKAKSRGELKRAFQDVSRFEEEVLIQEYIAGIPASVSLISSTNETVALTLNEQLLGISEVGQKEPFGYCGNVVPLSTNEMVTSKCRSIAEKIILHFGLIGSNGVDLVISPRGIPYVVEVNPRFQGTLECVERVLKINVVKAHLDACVQGKLPIMEEKTPSTFCVRLVLFALQRSITPDLSVFEEVRDIPMPGVILEEGEPMVSLVIDGASRSFLLSKARLMGKSIHKLLWPTK